jgi:hypothetical protein
MKTNKPKVQKKVAKKAAKKDLEKTLTERFLEVISQLGHDAGKVGDDISKAGKTIAKKLAKKVSKVQEAVGFKAESGVKKDKKALDHPNEKAASAKDQNNRKLEKSVKQDKTVKIKKIDGVVKAPKRQPQLMNNDVIKPRPLAQSVKVTPITSEARAAQALAKSAATKTATAPVKKRASRAKPKAEVFPEDPEMPENIEPA